MKNIPTTAIGCAVIVLAVLTAAPPILDDDPETTASVNALAEAITGVALILCREQRQHDKDAKRFLPAIPGLILLPALAPRSRAGLNALSPIMAGSSRPRRRGRCPPPASCRSNRCRP